MRIGRWVVLASAGATVLGAVACANVLGIGDRKLDPELGDASGDGGSCSDPCQMATGLNHPFSMAADEANVYWTEFGDDDQSVNGSVKACPVDGCGGGPVTYAALLSAPRGIAIDAQNVYFGTSTAQSRNGAIWSCAIGGCNGNPTKLVDADSPSGIAIDDTYVYWADTFDGTVSRVLKSGGAQVQLWDGGNGSGVGLDSPQSVAVDTSFAYAGDQGFNLYRVPLGGGQLVQMFAPPTNEYVGGAPIALDPSSVYFGIVGTIVQIPKTSTGSGGTPIATTVQSPSGLTVDPSGVLYWSDYGTTGNDGTVGKVPLDGGPAVAMYRQLVTPEAVAVNSRYAFWLSNGTLASGSTTGALPATGALYRSAK